MLAIFPEGGLAESVVTTVWVGVIVVAYFNLRFGWTFSGLVVPGYLVPPVHVEATRRLCRHCRESTDLRHCALLSEWFAKRGIWSSFFGRDRFFAIVLCSVVVRVALDGYLLPRLGQWLTEELQVPFDPVNSLHSFGLIIVSLIANQLWKPGLLRGATPLALSIVLTYLIVRYPLMHWTNFSVGSLEYMYEEISAAVLASPKAYIVLIVSAWIASRMNLLYSWDYNGILVPSLLALQWYEPLKVLTSFVEAWGIYLVAIAVLRLPLLRETTIEGSRKVLLFFNISFAYKMLLGHVVYAMAPTAQTTDYYGFGYLLPTLIAVKMHDKNIAARLTRTALQISVVGVAVASVVGFTLSLCPEIFGWSKPLEATAAESSSTSSATTLVQALRKEKVELYRQRAGASKRTPTASELASFRKGMSSLKRYLDSRDSEALADARQMLEQSGYVLLDLEKRYLVAREADRTRQGGFFVFDAQSSSSLCVEVPRPIAEWATPESGAYFFRLFGARALGIAPPHQRGVIRQSGDVLVDRRCYFFVFHEVFGGEEVLHVRGQTESLTRAMFSEQEREQREIPNSLWLARRLPETVVLRTIEETIESLEVRWGVPPERNVLRESGSETIAELFLRREDRKRLLGRFLLQVDRIDRNERYQRIDGFLRQDILERKGEIAERGSNLFVPPGDETLLFLDEEVLTPLVAIATRGGNWQSDEELLQEISAVHAASTALGYELAWFLSRESGREYMILREDRSQPKRRYWGTFVVRLGDARPFAVQIPRPLSERTTFEYGLSIFDKIDARYLLISGTHPKCNTDGSGDVANAANKRTAFNLMHQVILRDEPEPVLAVQVRAFGSSSGEELPQADALVSFLDGTQSERDLTPLGSELMSVLRSDRVYARFVAGDPDTAGYESGASAQARYLRSTHNKEFATLWLSPFWRMRFREDTDSQVLARHLHAADGTDA